VLGFLDILFTSILNKQEDIYEEQKEEEKSAKELMDFLVWLILFFMDVRA